VLKLRIKVTDIRKQQLPSRQRKLEETVSRYMDLLSVLKLCRAYSIGVVGAAKSRDQQPALTSFNPSESGIVI